MRFLECNNFIIVPNLRLMRYPLILWSLVKQAQINMRNVIRKDGMSDVGILPISNFADYGLKGLRVNELIMSL